MKKIQGYLRKMDKAWSKDQVQYSLRYVNYSSEAEGRKTGTAESIPIQGPVVNEFLGKTIHLEFTGRIRCVDCGRLTKKSFNQGSCYNCFITLASNDICILQPTECHYHLGTCREPEWGLKNCFKKHVVYLSITSGPKVGITKEKFPENRWIDQGAVEAIPILETKSRLDAGIIEEYIGNYIGDRTSWQKMVTGEPDRDGIDLKKERDKFYRAVENDSDLRSKIQSIKPSSVKKSTEFTYPILSYPKAKSIKVEPGTSIESRLIGIKGQYLLLEQGVINLRTYEGYEFIFYSL